MCTHKTKQKTTSVSSYLYSLTTETLFLIETTECVSLCIHLMHFFYFKNDTSTNIFMCKKVQKPKI